MAFTINDFRRHIFHSTTERVGFVLFKYWLLAQTEVCQFYMTISVEKNTEEKKADQLKHSSNYV